MERRVHLKYFYFSPLLAQLSQRQRCLYDRSGVNLTLSQCTRPQDQVALRLPQGQNNIGQCTPTPKNSGWDSRSDRHWEIYTPPHTPKIKVGFKVRATLGDVPTPHPPNFGHNFLGPI